MKNGVWFFALLAAILMPAVSSAQKLERTKNWEVGDKLTYNLVMGGRSMPLVEEVVEVTDAEIRMSQRAGYRTYEVAHSTRDLSRLKGVCFTNGQACQWSPGDVWADFPLEKGKRWSFTVTITGEAFISEQASERTVEAVEKIKTPAGEFEAYRVSAREQIKYRAKTETGTWYTGTAIFTYWLTSIKGKLVFLKNEYQNSFGATFTRELVSAELK